MRFAPGLIAALASASTVLAQAQGNGTTSIRTTTSSISTTTISTEDSSSATTSSAQPSGSAGPPVSVNLDGAVLGPGASKVTLNDGSVAIQLSAGPNGVATFSLGAPQLPEGVSVGQLIQVLFDLLVSSQTSARKRATTDCTLEVTVNNQPVFSQTLETTSGFTQQSTDGTPAQGQQDIAFKQTCGATASAMQVAHLEVAAGSGNGGNGGSSGTPSGTIPVPTGNNTQSATGTATGSGSASGTATGTATGSGTVPTPTGTEIPGFPTALGDFVLFGCVGSTGGFPSFSLAQSSASMDLNTCATACKGRSFFGVHDDDCYCGDSIDDSNTSRVPIDQCSIECPGDATQFCGGDRILQRRQSVPNTVLLTVYISLGGSTVTTTVTTSSVITTTITGPSTTQTQTVTAVYECFNGKCFPGGTIIVWIFNPYPGDQCDGQTVWVIDTCSCKGGHQYVPKKCSNGSCNGLVVYKPEECKDWYNKDVYYTPCSTNGTVTYKPWEDNWGTPEKPVIDQVPTCSGPGCPVPATNGGSSGGSSSGGSSSGGSSSGGSTPGGNTPQVVVGSATKSAVSGIAYIAAVIAAFL